MLQFGAEPVDFLMPNMASLNRRVTMAQRKRSVDCCVPDTGFRLDADRQPYIFFFFFFFF